MTRELITILKLAFQHAQTAQSAFAMVQTSKVELPPHTHSLPTGWQRVLSAYAKELLKLLFELNAWSKLMRRTWQDVEETTRYFRLIEQNVGRVTTVLNAGMEIMAQVRDALPPDDQDGDTSGDDSGAGNGDDEAEGQPQQQDVEGTDGQ